MNDAEQVELHMIVWGLIGWDMTGFDAWLEDEAAWPAREHARQRLRDGREALRHAYRQRASDELIELHAGKLLLMAQAEGMGRAGRGERRKVIEHGAVQARRRMGESKLTDAQKRRVIREYDAAPVRYGTTKALASKFDVSADTIRRVLAERDSIAAKPG